MKEIYVVIKTTGSYENRMETCVKAFEKKEQAEAFVKERNEYYDDLTERENKVGDDIENTILGLYHLYLKDVDPEYYQEYLNAEDDYDSYVEEHGSSFNYIEIFDWDIYYEKKRDFEENIELVLQYADKVGLRKDDKEDIKTHFEYEKKCDFGELPYFYVQSNPIILFEEGDEIQR